MHLILIFFLIIVVPFIVMPKNISAGSKSPYRIVLQGVIGTCVAVVLVFFVASLTGQGIFYQLQDAVNQMAKDLANDSNVIEMFKMQDTDEGERITFFTQLYGSVIKQLPASIMILSAISSYVIYIILSKSLGKRSAVQPMPKFREFSFPNGAVMGLVAIYLAAWLMVTTGMLADDALYANMNLIFDFAFSIQGISVILMFFHMKRFPKAIAVICAAIFWVTVIGRMMLVLLGMMDLILGLKARLIARGQRK